MLPYYAERFPTVEINYTFYRAPNEKILDGWNKATPERFKLTLKAPKRITHDRRLRDCGDPVRQFLETAATLGTEARRAAVSAAAEPEEGSSRSSTRFSMRFRRASAPPSSSATNHGWTKTIYARLRARNLALCVADSERLSTPVVITADYGYFRLRDEGYTPDDIARWGDVMREKTSALPRRLRLFQARRGREGAGVRDAADAASRRRVTDGR